MQATRKDVAKMAGVSTATVSYVLNGSKNVSEETASRVMKAVNRLEYRPNMIARSMSTNKSMQLSIVVENIGNPFFGEIIHGFEDSANNNGYFVNICDGFNKLDSYFDNFIARRVDGVFVTAMPNRFNVEKLYRLVEKDINIVVSGNVDVNMKLVSSIENDHITAMKDVFEYLYGLGHRNIAYLSGLGRNQKNDRRIEGYLAMIDKYGLAYGDDLLFDGKAPYSTDVPDGYRLACDLMESKRKFTAVICLNDLMAMGASNALQERGYRIPEDVSLVGFDGIPFTEYWNPPLTTMAMERYAFGQKAFQLLYANITDGTTGFYLNKLRLVERKSTAPCNR
ncbi:MAG TPA: LacI family DNA-binding transcriptional regulator [Caproiciproducens sp.]|nr:LacI family DNA-binding transcriptional regulator [Caproiciproducens sp.]